MNNFKRYDVVSFEDGEKVVVLESLLHDGIEYVYVSEVNSDATEITNNFYVMSVNCNDATLKKETNKEILAEILPTFQKMLIDEID